MTFNRVMKVAHTDRGRVPSFAVDASTGCPWCGAAIHAPGTSAPSASSEDRRDGRLAPADGIDGTVGVSGEAIPHQPNEEPWVYTVEEAAERLRIGRTLAYQMAQYESSRGRQGLPVIRLSNCLRVPRWALLDLAQMGRVEVAVRRISPNSATLPKKTDDQASAADRSSSNGVLAPAPSKR